MSAPFRSFSCSFGNRSPGYLGGLRVGSWIARLPREPLSMKPITAPVDVHRHRPYGVGFRWPGRRQSTGRAGGCELNTTFSSIWRGSARAAPPCRSTDRAAHPRAAVRLGCRGSLKWEVAEHVGRPRAGVTRAAAVYAWTSDRARPAVRQGRRSMTKTAQRPSFVRPTRYSRRVWSASQYVAQRSTSGGTRGDGFVADAARWALRLQKP